MNDWKTTVPAFAGAMFGWAAQAFPKYTVPLTALRDLMIAVLGWHAAQVK